MNTTEFFMIIDQHGKTFAKKLMQEKRTWECQRCFEQFGIEGDLISHIGEVHNDLDSDEVEGLIHFQDSQRCILCNKRIRFGRELSHAKEHTVEEIKQILKEIEA